MIHFENIHWRNSEDSSVFNIHAIKEIILDGMSQGIVTIKGETNTFVAPYYKLSFGGGIEHFSFVTKHPYEMGNYIEIAIFENKVCVCEANKTQEPWFEYKCRTFVPLF